MTARKHLRLATEGGRRVGRTPKAKRLAAKPAMDAARLLRALAVIRAEAEECVRRGEEASRVASAAWHASGGDCRITARALAREAYIESKSAGAALVVRYCEMAEEGTLCA